MYHNPLYELKWQPLTSLRVFENYLDTFASIDCESSAKFDRCVEEKRTYNFGPRTPNSAETRQDYNAYLSVFTITPTQGDVTAYDTTAKPLSFIICSYVSVNSLI